jgi:hypothetical protein
MLSQTVNNKMKSLVTFSIKINFINRKELFIRDSNGLLIIYLIKSFHLN